jgi:DNA-binding transcriptional MocR family regulator
VVVESPSFPHALDAARLRGARLVPVGVPDEGWHLDLLTCALRQSAARLAYLIPDYQNPTGHLMADADRAALVAEAAACDTTVIADESWTELAVDEGPRALPLAAFDRGSRVISVGSASKLWWGGLRIGWVRGTAALVRRLASLRAAVEIASPVFEQLVVAELFGVLEETRAERRRGLRAGRDALTAAVRGAFPAWRFTPPPGGGSLWVRLDAPVSTPLADAAASAGVRLAPGSWFGVDGTLEGHLRLPYTQPVAVLEEAVRRMAAADPGRRHARRADPLTPTL